MKRVFKDLILFVIFGAIYFGLECIWKGAATHWTMFLVGGLIGVLIGGINEKIEWDVPIFQQCTISMGVAIFCEAALGIVLNILLRLDVWHYTKMAFFWNQCSLPFCVIWFVLGSACIFLDDWLRWKLFGKEKPHYKLR